MAEDQQQQQQQQQSGLEQCEALWLFVFSSPVWL